MSMLSSPYVRILHRMTSRVTRSLESWAIFMVERCREGHAIIVLGQHRRSDDVRHDIPSSPLVSTHGRTTSVLAWNHIPCTTSTGSYNVRRGMSSSPVDSIHGQTTLGITCYNCPCAEHKVRRPRLQMTSLPLSSTPSRTMSGVSRHHQSWLSHSYKSNISSRFSHCIVLVFHF